LPYSGIIEIILGSSVIGSTFFLFLWLRKFFSRFPSFIGACSYVVSPYLLYDIYKRGSVGEVMASSVAIILMWCIESGAVWIIPPITALLLISHNILALFFTVFLVGYMFLRGKYKAVIPFVIGIMITSFFWIPALLERSFVRFDSVQIANPSQFMAISQTLLFWSFPLLLPLVLFLKKIHTRFDKEFLFFGAVMTMVAVGSSAVGMVFWNMPFFVRFVQFPYRLLSIVFIVGPWLLAFLISQLKESKRIWVGILCVAILFVGNIPLLSSVRSVVREEGFYTTNEGSTTVQDEYMPKWVKVKINMRANDKLVLFSGKGSITDMQSSTKKIDATLNLEDDSIIQFNTIFYPGWGATLDGYPIELSYDNSMGVMRVSVPKGSHRVSFEFRETAFRYISDILSSFGIIVYGAYLLILLSNNVKRRASLWI